MGTQKKAKQSGQTPAKVFAKAQEAPAYKQDKYQQQMMETMQEAQNEELFSAAFNKPLLLLLAAPYNVSYAKRMVKFTVAFLLDVITKENDEGQENFGDFLQLTFKYLFQIGKYNDKNMRFNVCSIFNNLLQEMAKQDLYLDEEFCEKLTNFLIAERICDKMAGVREEAARALQWLQDDNKPQCNVTKTLMFHMDRDPSCDVRRTILKVIRVTGMTLPAIVLRTRDVKEIIRVDAYKVLAERRKMTSLSYSIREKVIMAGLKDDSEAVREAVATHLLPHWLGQMEGGLLQFVRELDSETHPHIPRMVMQHLFKTKTIKELLEPLKPEGNEKFVEVDMMDPPLALYWSCLAEYLRHDEERKEESLAALEIVLPSVTELCNYVGMYYDTARAKMQGRTGEDFENAEIYRVSTLIHLLKLFDSCDLSDEAGRQNLCKMLERILSSSEDNKRVLITVTKQFAIGYVDPCQRANAVLSIIEDIHKPLHPLETVVPIMTESEHRSHQVAMAKIRVALCNLQVSQEKAIDLQDFRRAEELKVEIKDKRMELEAMENSVKPQADPEVEMEREEVWDLPVIYKCLIILAELMRKSDVFKASIGLVDIMESFVLKCLATEDEQVMPLTIEIIGMYCLQRVNNAKKSLPVFYALLNHDVHYPNAVRAMCVRCICANIVQHGLAPFNIPEEEPVFVSEQRVRLNTSVRPDLSFFSSISYLMDDMSEVVRNEAIIGLCKLVMSGRITSAPLLSKLILLWFNPTTGSNKQLMKMLGQFLSYYPAFHYEAPKWLVKCLVPTLDMVLEAPHSSSLIDIDPKEIGLFILDMTRPGKNKHYKENPHDAIAAMLMGRIAEEIAGDTVSLLLRLCINLQLSLDKDDIRLPLLDMAKKLKKDNMIDKKNKDMDKLILMLRSTDSSGTESSQLTQMESETLSQESQNSSEVSTKLHPCMLPQESMDIDSQSEDGGVSSRVVPRKPGPRSKRPAQHVSESDSD